MSKKRNMSRRILRQYFAILNGYGDNSYHVWYRGNSAVVANAWAALHFYKQFSRCSGIDFNRLQRIVILDGDANCVYRWAKEVKGANTRKCQVRMMEIGTPEQMRKFALNVSGAHLASIENLATIKEVLAL